MYISDFCAHPNGTVLGSAEYPALSCVDICLCQPEKIIRYVMNHIMNHEFDHMYLTITGLV